MPRAEVDPVYFSTPCYVYPDGPISVEIFRVIGAAMADAGEVGIGRITLSRRERLVMVEPRDAGMVLITLQIAARAVEFDNSYGASRCHSEICAAIRRGLLKVRGAKDHFFDNGRRRQTAYRRCREPRMAPEFKTMLAILP